MFKSLRWRLQVWHALVLLVVLLSFGGVVYDLHWQTRLQQVDAELHRTVNIVRSQMRRLVPWSARRPRRTDESRPETELVTRTDQNVVLRPDTSTHDLSVDKTSRSSEPLTPDQQAREELAREQLQRERLFRDPGPLPAEFEQLFHGDEDSRLYFVIWGKDGEVLQKSESAPQIPYPNLHEQADALPVRTVRERRGDHIYREVVTCVPQPRSSVDPADRNRSPSSDMNLVVGRSLEKDLAAQHQSGLRLTVMGLVILGAGVLGGGWLSSRAIQPINAMTAAAEAISAQNLSERISVKDTDSELGKLARVLNGTFDRLQSAFERQRQFTADASHELRTPLSVISTHMELALSRPRSNDEYRAAIDTCWRASKRMRSLIDALLLLARFDFGAPPLKKDRLDLEALLHDCLELAEPLAAERNVQLESQMSSSVITGDWDRLSQVFTNLLTNAIRYNVDGGRVCVQSRIENRDVIVSVIDTGVGIPDDQVQKIFDRFYQVDKARSRAEGSCGLGLSICKTIVEGHGGTISATSQLGVGTTLDVRLPLTVNQVTAEQSDSSEMHLSSTLVSS